MDVELVFKFEKETKGTVRFKEVEGEKGAVVGTLYIRKSALSTPYPDEVKVVISY